MVVWAGVAGAQAPDAGVAVDGGAVEADASPPSPSAVTLPDGRQLDVGCVVRVARPIAQSMYVICDDGRLLWVDVGEGYVEAVSTRGTAVDLFEHNGRLWVELVRHEALALDPGMPGTLSASPPPAEAEPTRPVPAPPLASVPPAAMDWERPYEPDDARPLDGRLVGWEVSGHLRPFIAEKGGGALFEIAGHYGFSGPVYVRLEVDPLGGAAGDDPAGVFGAAAILGYDHELFQIGIGIGTWYVAIRDVDRFAEGLAATLHNAARIGRRDGVHIEAKTTLVWVDDEVFFGGIEGRVQAPIGRMNYLLFQGGGGIDGHVYGEIGARIWVTQRDDGRGLYLIPAMGAAGIRRDGIAEVVGPSVSLGFEVRP